MSLTRAMLMLLSSSNTSFCVRFFATSHPKLKVDSQIRQAGTRSEIRQVLSEHKKQIGQSTILSACQQLERSKRGRHFPPHELKQFNTKLLAFLKDDHGNSAGISPDEIVRVSKYMAKIGFIGARNSIVDVLGSSAQRLLRNSNIEQACDLAWSFAKMKYRSQAFFDAFAERFLLEKSRIQPKQIATTGSHDHDQGEQAPLQ